MALKIVLGRGQYKRMGTLAGSTGTAAEQPPFILIFPLFLWVPFRLFNKQFCIKSLVIATFG
jgi:hypothetical protein